MFIDASAALIVAMVLILIRAILGPTIYDRILAVNLFGTKALLLIAVMGFLTDRPEFLDIALVYALINFIATIAIMKFFRFAHLGHPHTEGPDAPVVQQHGDGHGGDEAGGQPMHRILADAKGTHDDRNGNVGPEHNQSPTAALWLY